MLSIQTAFSGTSAAAERVTPTEIHDPDDYSSCDAAARGTVEVSIGFLLAHADGSRAFWNFLVRQEKTGAFPFLKTPSHPIRILLPGSGAAIEAPMLASFFGTGVYLNTEHAGATVDAIDRGGHSGNSITYTMRYRDEAIEEDPPTAPLLSSVRYLVADASRQATYEKLYARYDFVAVMNPEILGGGQYDDLAAYRGLFDRDFDNLVDRLSGQNAFREIFSRAVERLASNGVILVTTHMQDELEAAKNVLEALGLEIFAKGIDNFAYRTTSYYGLFRIP